MAKYLNTPSLVIVGSWNPAIFTPEWLKNEVYEVESGDSFGVRLQFPTIPGPPVRLSTDETTYTPTFDRLTIAPVNNSLACCKVVEERAIKILEKLSHTPITGFGQNTEILVSDSNPKLNELFGLNDGVEAFFDSAVTKQTNVTKHIGFDHCSLNLSRILNNDNGEVIIRLNFHYEVKSAEDAINSLRGSVERNFALAEKLVNGYGITIDDENGE